MKICKTCKLNKDLKEYHFKKSGKFKVNAHCKVCVCLNKKEYYKNIQPLWAKENLKKGSKDFNE